MFKKLLKLLLLPFKLIYLLIDKLIVTPISRIIYKINEFSKDNVGRFERILNRPNVLIYLSLIFAIAIFLLIDSKVVNLTEKEAEIISDQKISVLYNDASYVVEGIPEVANITLIGNKSTIYLATQLGDHEVLLDLSKYGPGTYKVKLKYKHSVQAVDYKLDPSTVTVKISEKVGEVKNLSYDIINEDKLDSKLSISKVKLDTNEVIVKSSQEILDKVATVKALIDASQIDIKESGDYKFDAVTLVAYNDSGDKLGNLDIVPSKVGATVTIDSYHDKKPLKIITKGTMSSGKAIASITSSVTEVEVYGDKEIVDNLNFLEAEVDIDGLKANKTTPANIIKPSGIRYMSATKSNVSISVGDAAQKTINGVSVEVTNLGSSYTASAATKDDRMVDVIVKGVESIINKEIDASKIRAYVDLADLRAGTHTVPVYVSVEDERVQAQSTKTEISVKIVEK